MKNKSWKYNWRWLMDYRLVWSVGLMLCFNVVSSAQKQAFSPYQGKLTELQQDRFDRIIKEPTTKRFRMIHVSPAIFAESKLFLNLFPGVQFEVTQFNIGNTGIFLPSWVGRNDKRMATASFVLEGEEILGNINSFYGTFELLPLGGGDIHLLVELDNSKFPSCGNHGNVLENQRQESRKRAKNQPPVIDDRGTYSRSARMDEECNIRIVVAYTALAQANSVMSMTALVQLGVMNANTANAVSNVNQRMELAYLYETDDNESNNACNDVDDLQDTSDGRFDEVHAFRNTYDGDMVALITGGLYATNPACNPNGGLCGIAFDFDFDDPTNMFQVTEFDCFGGFTFHHEFGHTQGLRHDNDGNTDPFEFAHGFNDTFNGVRTVMAVNSNPTTRLNRWSNPDLNFPGTTSSTGTDDFNDNARALDEGEDEVISHRLTPSSITLSETIRDDEYVDMVTFDFITAINFSALNQSTVTLRTGEEILLSPEFAAESGSDVHVFIDPGCGDSRQISSLVGSDQDLENDLEEDGFRVEVFPNPTSDRLEIRYDLPEEGAVQMEVRNHLGQVVYQEDAKTILAKGHHQQAIEVQSWPAGLYSLVVQSSEAKIVKQFVVSGL